MSARERETFTFAYLQEPPFCFGRQTGAVAGCDVELARHVVEGLDAGPFQPIETEFAALLPGLRDGRWRMTTGLFVTEERRSLVRFSRPIWALHDGLLVAAGNPRGFTGYRSIGADTSARLAVIAGQVQHETALALGVPPDRLRLFRTQDEAADAVSRGEVEAYASVDAAHRGHLALRQGEELSIVDVRAEEKAPAFGAFAFALEAVDLQQRVDAELAGYLGSAAHRAMMARYGFGTRDVDRIAGK